jgi:hypothetical protein
MSGYNAAVTASTCVDYGTDCFGPVEFHAVGSGLHAWPRCALHALRMNRTDQARTEGMCNCDSRQESG